MTSDLNYRHGEMIRLVGAMDSSLLAVRPDRCVLVRHRKGDCLRCAAVCTTGAISLGEAGVVVSPEKCIGCGSCASACPTGCLAAANPTDEELFGAVEAALAENTGAVTIACERAAAMAAGDQSAIEVVCLGRVDESLLVEATARGARPIKLVSGPCERCPHHCGGALSDEIIASAENLLAALATPSPIERIRLERAADAREILRLRPTASAQDDTADIVTMADASGISGGAHQASSAANSISPVGCRAERGLSERLSTTRKPAPEESQPKCCESQFAHVQSDGTLPHFIPERRLRLFNSLKALGAPAEPTVATRLWGQVTIDTELCRSCRMCTVFCPTGALARFDAADGAFGVEHRSTLCMQCRLCETICPEGAITVAEDVSTDEFLTGKKLRFTMQPIGWNPGAEDSIASRMARFIKVDNLQEPQAKVRSFDTAARREYAQAREARRREIRGETNQ